MILHDGKDLRQWLKTQKETDEEKIGNMVLFLSCIPKLRGGNRKIRQGIGIRYEWYRLASFQQKGSECALVWLLPWIEASSGINDFRPWSLDYMSYANAYLLVLFTY